MAPSDENRATSATDDKTNPFVAFRRFADEQMSSVMNTVFGAFQSSPIKRQESIERYEALLKKSRENSVYDHPVEATVKQHGAVSQEQAPPEVQMIMSMLGLAPRAHPRDDSRNIEEQAHDTADDQPLRCPYRPADSPTPPNPNSMTSIGRQLTANLLAASLLGENTPSFPVSYIFHDPYSPLVLEQTAEYRQHSGKWRAAFADLLAAQSGQDLSPKSQRDEDEQLHGEVSPSDWTSHMVGMALHKRQTDVARSNCEMWDCIARKLGFGDSHQDTETRNSAMRGGADTEDVTSPNLATSAATSEHQTVQDLDGETEANPALCQYLRSLLDERGMVDPAETEQDQQKQTASEEDEEDLSTALGLHMGHPAFSSENPTSMFAQSRPTKTTTEASNGQTPSVLSTLTTTEQRTLPDGTMTTKIVLKKRFADGGEESTERIYTENARGNNMGGLAKSDMQRNFTEKKETDSPKKGWFWS